MFSVTTTFKSADNSGSLPKLFSVLTSFFLFLLNASLAKAVYLYLVFKSVTAPPLLQMLFEHAEE